MKSQFIIFSILLSSCAAKHFLIETEDGNMNTKHTPSKNGATKEGDDYFFGLIDPLIRGAKWIFNKISQAVSGDYVDLGENGEVSIPEDVKEIFKNPKAVEQWIKDKIKNGENGKVPIPEEVKGLFKKLNLAKEGDDYIDWSKIGQSIWDIVKNPDVQKGALEATKKIWGLIKGDDEESENPPADSSTAASVTPPPTKSTNGTTKEGDDYIAGWIPGAIAGGIPLLVKAGKWIFEKIKQAVSGDYVDLAENGEVSIPEDIKGVFKNPKAVEQWIEDKIKNGENGKVPIPEEVKGLFKNLKEGDDYVNWGHYIFG